MIAMAYIPGTRALRTLAAAGKHLNFTRAAEELGLTPAAVSHQVKEFEDQLGVSLFWRTSRTIRPTEAGTTMIEAATEALDLLGRAASKARKAGIETTTLRLTMESTFAAKWLMPRLARFRAQFPDIELRFDITDKLRDFDRDDVDAGIRFGAGRYPGLIAEQLFDNVVVPVCGPALLQGTPPLNEPRDLFNHTLCHAVWSMEGATWPTWRVWMAAAGIPDFDDSRCINFDDSGSAVQAALDGNAVALIDLALVADDLAAGRLVRPFDIGIRMEPQFAFYLVYPQRGETDLLLQSFRGWLLDEAKRTDTRGV